MRVGAALVFGAIVLSVSLAGCGDRDRAKAPGTPQERIAAALDACAQNDPFAAQLCQNQTISALTSEVEAALVAEAASVSDAGADMLVQNEQRWRIAQRIACGIIDPDAAPSAEQQTCLEGVYRARAAEAASAVEEVGGYVFQRMELVDATPVTAEAASASGLGEEAPAAITRDIRFPRIDGQQTPAIQRFNELVAQQPQFGLEDATSEYVNYQIAYAGQEIISVRFDVSMDTLGAAHPNSSSKAVTVVMTSGEPLREADVFTPTSRWQDFLTERAMQELTRAFREYDFTPPRRDVRESATKPHLWLVTEQGLVILFPPYSFGGPYALGGAEVMIPWTDLRPYLNPAAPAPIRAAA